MSTQGKYFFNGPRTEHCEMFANYTNRSKFDQEFVPFYNKLAMTTPTMPSTQCKSMFKNFYGTPTSLNILPGGNY
jgi:hypothetical protein